ncbi:MAG: glycoside hydrolase family 28 protein, partial [Lachnospiraceae bacterium]|nr:glycoside hydrolase family 28 protein [Lachnospiraceae bacterium]
VQSREAYPVDERTPVLKKMLFENMECTNCHVAAAYFDCLPELKMEELELKHVHISYADDAKTDVPAMSEGVAPCCKKGLFARNIHKLILEDVTIDGQVGEPMELIGVDTLIQK